MRNGKLVGAALVVVVLFSVMAGSGAADLDDSYADEVVSYTQGNFTGGGEPPGTWGWTDRPDEALGSPTEFSMAMGSSLP